MKNKIFAVLLAALMMTSLLSFFAYASPILGGGEDEVIIADDDEIYYEPAAGEDADIVDETVDLGDYSENSDETVDLGEDEYIYDTVSANIPTVASPPIAEITGITCLYNGNPVSGIILEDGEKMQLSVPEGDFSHIQWQILLPGTQNSYVNISGQTGSTVDITMSMVKNMLSSRNKTSVRFTAAVGGSTVVSRPVMVAVNLNEVKNDNNIVIDDDMFYFNYAPMQANFSLFALEDDPTYTPEYVTITVTYTLSGTGERIFDDYVATLQYGSNFSADIPSPRFIGYAPFINETEPAEIIKVELSRVEQNMLYEVVYYPSTAPYGVDYYLQNLNDDNYTLDAKYSFTAEGTTGEYPTAVIDINIDGFTSIFHVPDFIAADGSTIFNCYYDRNYYLYSFDCNGGYGAEPIYARYETPVVTRTPTRKGYKFMGWDMAEIDADGNYIYDGIVDYVPRVIGKDEDGEFYPGNKTFRAIWKADKTTFTVVYWNENPDDDRYNYWDSRVITALSGSHITYDDLMDRCILHDGRTTITATSSDPAHPVENLYDNSSDNYWQAKDGAEEATIRIDLTDRDYHITDKANVFINISDAYIDDSIYPDPDKLSMDVTIVSYYVDGTYAEIIKETVALDDDFSLPRTTGNEIIGLGIKLSNRQQLLNGEWVAADFPYAIAEIEVYNNSVVPLPDKPSSDVVTENEFNHYSLNEDRTWQIFYQQYDPNESAIVVAGDGSTVVNIYYKRNVYHYRFIYQRKDKTTGKYQIIGGGSQAYGGEKFTLNGDKTDYVDDYSNMNSLLEDKTMGIGNNWVPINEPVKLSQEGQKLCDEGKYTIEQVPLSGCTYIYYAIELNMKYGQSFLDTYPIGMFEPVSGAGGQYGDYAVHSSWTGNPYVSYSYKANAKINTMNNRSVKGKYIRAEGDIVYDDLFADKYELDNDNNYIINLVAFWENAGNKVNWNKAYLWRYNVYLEMLPEEIDALDPAARQAILNNKDKHTVITTVNPDGTITEENYIYSTKYGNVYYHLYQTYFCTDNNKDIENQTATATKGYTLKKKVKYGTFPLDDEQKEYYYYDQYDNNSNPLGYEADFYYLRDEYQLRIYNNGVYEPCSTGLGYIMVLYGKNLINEITTELESYIPPYPQNLELGAYSFEGWYTSPLFLDGSEVTPEATMLATPMTVYAKWVPVNRNVTFSHTELDMQSGAYIDNKTFTVLHGDLIEETIPTPQPPIPDSEFLGWFYYDLTGNKHAYDPGEMAVTSDMHVFADWRAPDVAQYTVRYILEDGTVIADETLGYAYVGSTKTFTAKTGSDLYIGYQSQYYPTTNSSSLLVTNGVDGDNVVIIKYRYKDYVNYTIKYVDAATGEDMVDEDGNKCTVEGTTKDAVITQMRKYFPGYIADDFHKTLVLSINDDENVITFYYTKDDFNALYAIQYWIEELDGSYSLYYNISHPGEINSNVSYSPTNITGFTYSQKVTQEMYDLQGDEGERYTVTDNAVSATLEAGSNTILALYYTRNDAYITLKFADRDDPTHIFNYDVKLKGKYGQQLTFDDSTAMTYDETENEEHAVIEVKYPNPTNAVPQTIHGYDPKMDYTLVTQFPYNLYFNEDDEQEFVFFYIAPSVVISYQVVCKNFDEDLGNIGGELTQYAEKVTNAAAIGGSRAEAWENYTFIGWYHDKECTSEVAPDWIIDKNTILPKELLRNEDGSDSDQNIYYALFEPDRGDLMITKSGNVKSTDAFMFRIRGTEGTVTQNIDLIVSIVGNGSVTVKDLPWGNYTVTELTDWSWRYEAKEETSNASVSKGTTCDVEFTNEPKDRKWLGGEATNNNRFNAVS